MLKDFFIEFVNRLRTKSPKFFRVLQVFALIVIGLGYLPWVVNRYLDGVTLPHGVVTLCNDIAGKGVTFLIGLLFAVRTPPVAQTEGGVAVQVTNEKKMPFTAKDEAKVVEKKVPPPPVAHDVPEVNDSDDKKTD